MHYNYNKLRGKIVEKYNTVGAFATRYGVSIARVSQLLNNKAKWNTDNILRACDLLGIENKDIPEYFFDLNVLEVKQ